MAKYDTQLADTKSKLASANNIIVALPSQITVDKLAAGLALFLSLEQLGKSVSIVSEGVVLVAYSNIYGAGKVKNQLPQTSGGDFTLTLEGVVAADGTVPSLEKLDWFPEGNNLNLVFHVLPGKSFQPSKIVPKHQAVSGGLIFVIGAVNLNELGGIYTNNEQAFTQSQIVNIDNNTANTKFGQVNIVDQSPSVSAMVAEMINGLGLAQNSDIASNILAGIYNSTNNLTTNVTPDIFVVVGQAMQAGGKIPGTTTQAVSAPVADVTPQPTAPQAPAWDYKQFMPPPTPVQPSQVIQSQPAVSQPTPIMPSQPAPLPSGTGPTAPTQDAFSLAQNPFLAPQPDQFTMPSIASSPAIVSTPSVSTPISAAPVTPVASTEERPAGEFTATTSTETPESQPSPDWLTPKVYKGTSLG